MQFSAISVGVALLSWAFPIAAKEPFAQCPSFAPKNYKCNKWITCPADYPSETNNFSAPKEPSKKARSLKGLRGFASGPPASINLGDTPEDTNLLLNLFERGPH